MKKEDFTLTDGEKQSLKEEINRILAKEMDERFHEFSHRAVLFLRIKSIKAGKSPNFKKLDRERDALTNTTTKLITLLEEKTSDEYFNRINSEYFGVQEGETDVFELIGLLKSLNTQTTDAAEQLKYLDKESDLFSHRAPKVRLQAAIEIARALKFCGVTPTKTRGGGFDEVFKIILQSARTEINGVKISYSLPDDTFPILKESIETLPKTRLMRWSLF